VIVIMSGKSYMLPEIEGGEEREKLRCERVSVIINVYIKVASDEELVRCSSSQRQEGRKLIKEDRERLRER